MANELWRSSATELAEMIAGKQVKSREVIDAHLDRIAAVNPALNAITVEMAEAAQAAADVADSTTPTGPLHGVPFSIKENIDQLGFPTTQGVGALANAVPTSNAVTTQRMLDAGAIPIGRTNMPEFGLRVSTDNALRGLTRSPWSFDHTAGGSSGGEGSAIASGMSPIGLGNDIGGSLRNPALCCGIAALKPGYGRIPRMPSLPPTELGLSAQLMAVEGPMARTVADLRVGYEVLSGPHVIDPRVAAVPLDGAPVAKRCGVVRSLETSSIGAGSMRAINDAAAAMEAAGWEVIELEVPELLSTHELWQRMLAFDFAPQIETLRLVMGEREVRLLEVLVESARALPGTPPGVFTERLRVQKLWSAMFANTPVVIGPGWNNEPFKHDEDIAEGAQMSTMSERLSFIIPGNVLGYPVAAISNGVHEGLPVGVQVYANHWREDLCLTAAAAIEAGSRTPTPIDPVWV